ncbi:alkaline phosphatase D family protein [Sphingomonas sp. HDW15A]|uniref:alkaline phosphatase D family protein n=1 Tax=Sphingomonas sp. HDW15A TaxID=2714942 RepID=UPI0019D09AE2|nr:alkaline phosphatase D family protein [Sphingomonas sp. HDW15A]
MALSRRDFMQLAAAMGASLAWTGTARASRVKWTERRDLFPEGVASGDPDPNSIILWTRRPFESGRQLLTVEVAEDVGFRRVVAQAPAPVSAASDWTTRVLVGGLKPARTYWYRFTDSTGNGSRVGRTITAPAANDPRAVNFAFVSCQDINEGKLNGYRRMIFEDERKPAAEQLGFVLHLGDFIYEVVQYPDEVKTRYGRAIYEVARLPAEPDSFKVGNFHMPLTVEGYRAIYKGYLHDPDLQDARARWPFVCIWDNHEFSWVGRQSMVQAGGQPPRPGQTVKVAANQAWFEYIPARVKSPSGTLAEFGPPVVKDVEIKKWDKNGLGLEPNNLTAIRSLIAYRALRYGRHLDLIITDQYSFKGADPSDHEDIGKIYDPAWAGAFPEPVMIALDAGRTANGGNPPATLSFRDATIPNPSKDSEPRTILGVEQKAWFKDQLKRSTATWKIWANSLGALDIRIDPEHIPASMVAKSWPANTFGILRTDEWGAAYQERGEIYDLVRDAKITGFAIVSGDRHSFWAGYAAAKLPPNEYEPVGLSFVGGSLVSPGRWKVLRTASRKTAPCARSTSLIGRGAVTRGPITCF